MASTEEVTQITIFTIPAGSAAQLANRSSQPGQIWHDVLDVIQSSAGFQHLYWGRNVEAPEFVHIHTVRQLSQFHDIYLTGGAHEKVLSLLKPLTTIPPTIRHASLKSFTPGVSPYHAPFSGTAIYLSCTPGLWDAAWNLWTHIVPTIEGAQGAVGGYVQEPVDGHVRNFVVFVGWKSRELHDAFHHTQFFFDHWIILKTGTTGWTEYGHVEFLGERKKLVVSKF